MAKDQEDVVKPARMKIINQASIIIVVAIWLLAAGFFRHLPADVPIHFNWQGAPDHVGSKKLIFILPVLATLLNLLLGYLARHPELHNYPVKITKANSASWYERSAWLLFIVRLIVSAIFLVLTLIVIVSALRCQSDKLFYLLTALVLAIPAGIAWVLIRPLSSKPS
ncbi:DUF1648 domain-containing protein [Flavihumibacter rivuli]|uniref:DUF1648 domain-containing protein n=1 Tax=Flavihumibacter rivuli TaxID=2838156 RepID=UPI001BDEF171|nr:DUF1648 domain-containing protein [Flavihumibacter rivuli]ULQ58088.1 DUF1648 domain-containing protein [Flavihumibacter rivuli]